MIVFCGAELYTSMCAYMAAAWWENKVSALTCVRMWVVTWVGNFVGCAIAVGLLYSTEIYEGREWYTLLLAQKKVQRDVGLMLAFWALGFGWVLLLWLVMSSSPKHKTYPNHPPNAPNPHTRRTTTRCPTVSAPRWFEASTPTGWSASRCGRPMRRRT